MTKSKKKSKNKGDTKGHKNKEKQSSSESLPHEDPLDEEILLEESEQSDNGALRFVEPGDIQPQKQTKKLKKKKYEKELRRLQIELVKLQEWIKQEGLKVVVIFEGRDAAGKGGVIKRITQVLNPRIARVVALGVPTEREKTQWYFQRYVPHLPAAGEIVLFDRSWYNRAGVERVMGFCTDDEYWEFMRTCPEFERMLVRSGMILIKYWFSVSDSEQEKRFLSRIDDRTKRWKLSPMDVEARSRWVEYSRAKDVMMKYTDIKQAPWYVVNADVKMKARLNCIAHLLNQIPYQDLTPDRIELPPRQSDAGYVRPPYEDQTFVPEVY
jgi:polyphosphate kinase